MPQEAKRIYSSSPESEKGASPLEYEGQEVQPVLTTETQDSLPTKTIASLFVTAISSDIIGFTDLSEQLGHKEATALLNRYYAIWTRCAGSYGGRIVSISADTVVILFGLVDQERSADRALNASYAFIEELEGLREDMIIKSLPGEIKVSLGVHSGFVTRALLGPPGQQKISFFGDTIGIAARLDSLCREFHQSLLVSHATYRRLTLESQVTLERFSEALLRKSTRPMPLYTKKP